MELSWWALAPTIAITLVLAVAVLLRPGKPASTDLPKPHDEAASGDPLPTLGAGLRDVGTWLRNSRKPVWPIDYADLNVRVRRGFKLAGVMGAVIALVVGAREPSHGSLDVLLGAGTIVIACMFIAFGCIASIIHSLILQLLPYRGPIVSTALGAVIGGGVVLLFHSGDVANIALIVSVTIYGFIIGILNFVERPQARKTRMRPTA